MLAGNALPLPLLFLTPSPKIRKHTVLLAAHAWHECRCAYLDAVKRKTKLHLRDEQTRANVSFLYSG